MEINTPWRIEESPTGWGNRTVMFDSTGECLFDQLYPSKDVIKMWEHIVKCVNERADYDKGYAKGKDDLLASQAEDREMDNYR